MVVVAVVAIAALQPADFKITHSETISAPPAAVFAEVSDFRNWSKWSPYEKLDPAMKRTFGPQTSGVGAS